MSKSSRKGARTHKSLDERFAMDRGLPSDRLARQSQLWMATGREDGEAYLLHLFQKTGSDIDHDLRRLFHELVRRIRGVLSTRAARGVLVEIVDVVEDDAEFGLRLYGSGTQLNRLPTPVHDRLVGRARTTAGRVSIWRQIARLARALGYLHAADIVHGGVGETAIFVENTDPPEFKLGGYEGSVHVGSVGEAAAGLLKPGSIVSLSRDWSDLGSVAATLFSATDPNGPSLLPSEQRLLDRLRRPPQFEHIDGASMAAEIEDLCAELDRVGSSGRHELLVVPSRDVIRRDLPSLAGKNLQASDIPGLLSFLSDDLTAAAPLVWKDPYRAGRVLAFTDLAAYEVRADRDDARIGRLTEAKLRSPNDPTLDAIQTSARLHVCRDPKEARERVGRSGGGAASWSVVGERVADEIAADDPPQWHALILIEVLSLLAGRLDHYPVEIVDTPETGLVRIASRQDTAHDGWRGKLGRSSAARLQTH